MPRQKLGNRRFINPAVALGQDNGCKTAASQPEWLPAYASCAVDKQGTFERSRHRQAMLVHGTLGSAAAENMAERVLAEAAVSEMVWLDTGGKQRTDTPSSSDGFAAAPASQERDYTSSSSSDAAPAVTTPPTSRETGPPATATSAQVEQQATSASPPSSGPLAAYQNAGSSTAVETRPNPCDVRPKRGRSRKRKRKLQDISEGEDDPDMPFRQRLARTLGESVRTSSPSAGRASKVTARSPPVAGSSAAATAEACPQTAAYPHNSHAASSHGAKKKEKKKKIYGLGGRRNLRSSALTMHNDQQLSPSQKVLSYYDVNLTVEDMKALRGDWLTDNMARTRGSPPVSPGTDRVAASVHDAPTGFEKLEMARQQLPDFKGITHIFLPITDARDLERAEGGTHWSLLLVSTIDGVAFHYDSLGISNISEAQRVTRKLQLLLNVPLKFQNIDDCPQQENGNDCGVFVCILMRHLLVKRLLNANAREKVSMSMYNKMIDAHGGRKEMLKIIESLRKEAERRRSTSPFPKPEEPRIE